MKDCTDITCIIDRSGSMAHLTDETIASFNKFIAEQQAIPGEARITISLFDHEIKFLCDGVDLKESPLLDTFNYHVGGSTALFDALGSAIDKVGSRLSSLSEDERPNNVVFFVITDGGENASRDYQDGTKLKDKITEQQNVYNWKFIFTAANQDAFATSSTLGINPQFVSNYTASAIGTQVAYAKSSDLMRSIRTNKP